MIKAVIKTLVLVAILFVMLYVGMTNSHTIDFRFPVAGFTDKAPVRTNAALIYFAIFAIGLVGGTVLAIGGGKGGKKNGGGK